MAVGINAPVDAFGNVEVNLPLTETQAGFATLLSEVDAGDVTGTRLTRALEVSEDYRTRVGLDVVILDDLFLGVAINTALWFQASTVATITVSAGYLALNAGNSVAANSVARVQSYRTFPVWGTVPLYVEFWGGYFSTNSVFAQNAEALWGIGLVTGTGVPTEGAFFRVTPLGAMVCEVYYASVIQQVAVIEASLITINTSRHYIITCGDNYVEFWIDATMVARITTNAVASGTVLSQMNMPVQVRTLNSAVAPAFSVREQWSRITVSLGDVGASRQWVDVLSGMGFGGYQGQTGGTMGPNNNYLNSAAPVSIVLANAGPGYTTLGGQFQFAAVGGIETDYVLFGFQVPTIVAGGPSKNLYIRSVWIDTFNTVVAVATTAHVLQWAIAVGTTAVTLATTEGAGTKVARRITLGVQSFPVGAAAGALAPRLEVDFPSPLLAESGTFVQIILKMPIATATATQIIRGIVGFNANFE